MRARIAALAMLTLPLGCFVDRLLLRASTVEQPQVVRGVLRHGSEALGGRKILLAGRDCSHVIAELTTDTSGRFEHVHSVPVSSLAVIVQELAICEPGSGAPLCSVVWGPAPGLVALDCDLARAPARRKATPYDDPAH